MIQTMIQNDNDDPNGDMKREQFFAYDYSVFDCVNASIELSTVIDAKWKHWQPLI